MATEKLKGANPMAWLLSSTKEQAKDTGMAMVLICLLLGYWGKFPKFLPVSLVLLILTMAWPNAFRPLAVLWFGLSHLLSQVMSRVILTVVFFLVVTPIGVIRRLMRGRCPAVEEMETRPGLGVRGAGGTRPGERYGEPVLKESCRGGFNTRPYLGFSIDLINIQGVVP